MELAGHALRLTPQSAPERPDRLLALAEYLDVAGEDHRLTDLLTPEIDALPPGVPRARAHLLLADGGVPTHADEIDDHLEQAVAQSTADPLLRASALAMTAVYRGINRVQRIAEAEALALEALAAAHGDAAGAESVALFALGWTRILRGDPIDHLRERSYAISDTAQLYHSLDRLAGVRLLWRGEVGPAREILAPMPELADERDEPASYFVARLHLCELALRTGDWDAAARVLEEWDQSSDAGHSVVPIQARCRALLAAGRGQSDEADRWARVAIAEAQQSGLRWDELEALRARGIGALLAHDPGRAIASLREVWEHTCHEGVDELGAFPVASDLVEALTESGGRSEALVVTERLRLLAEQQCHPWGLATARRCGAIVQLATGRDERAIGALTEAAADYERLGLRFDRARTLLAAGRAQRRLSSGAPHATRFNAPRAPSTHSDHGVGRARALAAGGHRCATTAAGRRAHAGRAARRAIGGGRTLEQGDRRTRSTSACTRSSHISRTSTRSWACARAPSSRAVLRRA